MLDKDQIQDWDGAGEKPAPKPVPPPPAAPVAPAAPVKAVAATLSDVILHSAEAKPTGEFVSLTPEQKQARKRRGQWIAIGLFVFVIVIFTLTMTKMGANILVRDL